MTTYEILTQLLQEVELYLFAERGISLQQKKANVKLEHLLHTNNERQQHLEWLRHQEYDLESSQHYLNQLSQRFYRDTTFNIRNIIQDIQDNDQILRPVIKLVSKLFGDHPHIRQNIQHLQNHIDPYLLDYGNIQVLYHIFQDLGFIHHNTDSL